MIVGESAGSMLVAGVGDPGSLNAAAGAARPRSSRPVGTTTERFFVGKKCAEFLTDLDRVANFRFPFAHHAGKRRLDRINGFVGFDFAQFVI